MLSPDYILGLTDGEGSFNIFLHPPHKSTKYYRVEFHYYIKLREDELPLLEKVKRFFNCGQIYLQKDKRKNHKNCYRYEVSSLRDLGSIIIPFFKENKLQSTPRKNDFYLFCKIFTMVVSGNKKEKHITDERIKKIKEIKMKMHK